MNKDLRSLLDASATLHEALAPLWDEAVEPSTKRELAVVAFSRIAHEHVLGQQLLIGTGLDVSALTLVRPSFEALLRAIWCLDGAEEIWIERFLGKPDAAATIGAETAMGPSVDDMLKAIKRQRPAWIYQTLLRLKATAWKPMNSYIHAGILPVIQSLTVLPQPQQCAVVQIGNGLVMLATNVVRMACGLRSEMLRDLQQVHAACLPDIVKGDELKGTEVITNYLRPL